MMTTDEAPLPKEAQLNWSRAFESLLWSTIQLLLVCFCSVDCRGLDPPPPMTELVGRVPMERANTRRHYSWRLRSTERSTGRSTGRLTSIPLKMKVEGKAHNPRKKQQKCRGEAEVVLFLQDDYRLHLNCVKEHQEVGVSCDAHGEVRVLVTSQSRKAHQDATRSPTHCDPINPFLDLATTRAGQQPKVAEKLYADHDMKSQPHEFCPGPQLLLAHHRKQSVPAWKGHRCIAFCQRGVGPGYSRWNGEDSSIHTARGEGLGPSLRTC